MLYLRFLKQHRLIKTMTNDYFSQDKKRVNVKIDKITTQRKFLQISSTNTHLYSQKIFTSTCCIFLNTARYINCSIPQDNLTTIIGRITDDTRPTMKYICSCKSPSDLHQCNSSMDVRTLVDFGTNLEGNYEKFG